MRRLNPIPTIGRLASRIRLACRYRFYLHYSWHLAWVKANAERI